MSDTNKTLLLRVPIETINKTKVAEADLIIDMDGTVVKDRHGIASGRQATQEEMDRAIEVYG